MNRAFFAVAILLYLNSCNLVEKDEELLASHKQANGTTINIYHVGVGATAEDVMQVRKGGTAQPVWVSKSYDTLVSSKLVNDTSLEVVFGSMGPYNKLNKVDTLHISIK